MTNYTLKVIDIRRETNDTITICFKQPGLKKVKYRAGQYLTLILRINGRRYVRPYSFSSAPGVDELLEITVKRVPGGIVSNHLHDVVRVGDDLPVLPPMGDFVYSHDGSDHVFLWGAGSGITPLISIAKDILVRNPEVKVSLVYGNRSHDSVIFADLIKKLLASYKGKFQAWNFLTQPTVTEQQPYLIQGRIDTASVLSIMKTVSGERSVHFICGPPGLKTSVKEALALLSITDRQIFSEDFELVKDPKDFENIRTRTVHLKFESQLHSVEVVKGKSILESALDAGIELPYVCQTGSCDTCMAMLLKGEAQMIGLTKERHDLMPDNYLLCCTYPVSDDVNIEIQ